jgi:hypothetical protein
VEDIIHPKIDIAFFQARRPGAISKKEDSLFLSTPLHFRVIWLHVSQLALTHTHFTFTRRVHLAKTVELCGAMSVIDAEAVEVCAGLTEEQLSSCVRPGTWSIAQNLAHLRTTTQFFLPTVDLALAESRKRKLHSQGPFGLSPYGRLLVWQMDAPAIFKWQAPKAIRPQLLDRPALELDHFLISQSAMRQRIADADGLNLTALRFSSPLASYLRLNLLEFFFVLNAHSRRHLRQANKVRRALLRPTPKTMPGTRLNLN